MPMPSYLAFLTATFVLILNHGRSAILAIGVSLAQGFRTGMANVVGASGAVAVQMMVLGLGLTPVLLFASQWFAVIRWAGVANMPGCGATV
jgi:homoserine/homoserine lactone efflux protein